MCALLPELRIKAVDTYGNLAVEPSFEVKNASKLIHLSKLYITQDKSFTTILMISEKQDLIPLRPAVRKHHRLETALC